MDSHLAHIESDDENTFLAELLNVNLSDHMTAAWIGLWKAEEDLHKPSCDLSCRRQGWTWSGNASISSKMEPKWNQYEPSGGHSCVRLKNTGEWWDKHCSVVNNYICEKPILHQPTPAAAMPDAPTTIEGNSESRQSQNTSETTSEEECPDYLPLILGAAVGGVLLGLLIACIAFIVLYRRMKHNHQIKRSEPTKHRSGLSAQDTRVVSEYDSNATYVNEIPCVALATAKQPDKASYVNGFDVNALTNEYEHLTEEKKTANQNAPTSDDDGAYTTINVIETSFPEVIP
ncbi:hypothetical protein CAPTEDRAFT_206280 [Capitella teleta]|uniref:C-type lectin domain-containing protein n=1 Tax=Capitella teleta TaxID=283909 RepID=R7TU51_CAPTE|nr:hypothetical protein CAPTEDRAFT_206280 [Capitella teleta]|eukprot:ELT94550.1 hypothetical protein CAPTEDRAFT_206280 [Capitella teleta]